MKWLLIAGCCYLGVVIVLWLLENRLVYQASSAEDVWEKPPSNEVEDVWLKTANDTKIHAWWYPHRHSKLALLLLHGNAGNLSQRGVIIDYFRNHFDLSVLIIDYPGYGKSEGRPTEQGCYDSADAAYQWLMKQQGVGPENIIIYGDSLGGGVAVDLASRKKHRALILIRTFTTLPDTAKHVHWYLPVHWLMRNRFASIDKIDKCTRPTFIAHGTHDSLIPYAQGKKLYEAAPGPKEFFPMHGSNHNDPLPKGMLDKAKEFLDAVDTSSTATAGKIVVG